MRLVHEQMLVEDDRSTGGPVLRATSINMVRGATKDTAAEIQRVAALKVDELVSRKASGTRQCLPTSQW